MKNADLSQTFPPAKKSIVSRNAGICLVAVAAFSSVGHCADWPSFRGPDYTGASKESNWNPKFNDPKIAWEAEVGTGAASFTAMGNRVLTSGNRDDKDTIWCFDLGSGKVLWKDTFPCKFEKRMFEGGTASTPTIDGDHVYNLSYDGQLRCLKLADGSLIWKVNLIDDFAGKLSTWKYAGSPLIQGNLVILDCGGEGNSTLALDKLTGKKVWGSGNQNAGYASPIPMQLKGEAAVLVFKGKSMVAKRVADGKQLWEVEWETSYDVNASSPVPLADGKLLITSGYGDGRAVLYDVAGSKPKELWRNDDIKTKMSSAVVYGDAVFAVCGDNKGKLVCVSLKTGKTLWTENGFGFGTLTLAGDKLVILGESGNLVIAEASASEYSPISEGVILKRKCWVNPTLVDGRILAKNNQGDTVCIDVR
ncbi:MAG: PQQ-like beta-propeller repeat protein [Verrucomicrobia bacterium]|nr:PQQ-like beta-propeller repeat protein [Verrucomicrobiota bacterium]